MHSVTGGWQGSNVINSENIRCDDVWMFYALCIMSLYYLCQRCAFVSTPLQIRRTCLCVRPKGYTLEVEFLKPKMLHQCFAGDGNNTVTVLWASEKKKERKDQLWFKSLLLQALKWVVLCPLDLHQANLRVKDIPVIHQWLRKVAWHFHWLNHFIFALKIILLTPLLGESVDLPWAREGR